MITWPFNTPCDQTRESLGPEQYLEIAFEQLLEDPLAAMRHLYTVVSAGGVRPDISRCDSVSAGNQEPCAAKPWIIRIGAATPRVTDLGDQIEYSLPANGPRNPSEGSPNCGAGSMSSIWIAQISVGEVEEHVQQLGVKFLPALLLHDSKALLARKRPLVRSSSREGIIVVRNGDDPTFERDILTGKPQWVPGTIPVLVVCLSDARRHHQHGGTADVQDGPAPPRVRTQCTCFTGREGLNDLLAPRTVVLDDLKLLRIEFSRLEQDVVGNTDLSHIVQLGRQLEDLKLGFAANPAPRQ